MKKVWLVVGLVAAGIVASTTYADVQNIRLSGDIRLRAYELINVGDNTSDESFISQRTRVTVEADLEDHVLVVATLRSEGLWGVSDESSEVSSGAGTGLFGSGRANRGWDVGLDEAYVQLNEAFYTPATVKLGRQYLNYGHGLIISSVEQEYNYDAARLVLDYYPLTVDVVYAKLAENTSFGAPFAPSHDTDLVFINGRYEMTDSLVKNIEGYFGYQIADGASGAASPVIFGIRSDMNLTEGLNAWGEFAYEMGSGAGTTSISAWLANLGLSYALKDTAMSPSFNASYTYASGGSAASGDTFVPWFDYVEGYNGYLFHPALANIHIINVGASIKPYENTTLAVQAYYYLRDDNTGFVLSNGSVDFGGTGIIPSGTTDDLGIEIDTILGYDYSKDVRAQLVYAVFIPDSAVKDNVFTDFDSVAHEIRGEINVKF